MTSQDLQTKKPFCLCEACNKSLCADLLVNGQMWLVKNFSCNACKDNISPHRPGRKRHCHLLRPKVVGDRGYNGVVVRDTTVVSPLMELGLHQCEQTRFSWVSTRGSNTSQDQEADCGVIGTDCGAYTCKRCGHNFWLKGGFHVMSIEQKWALKQYWTRVSEVKVKSFCAWLVCKPKGGLIAPEAPILSHKTSNSKTKG